MHLVDCAINIGNKVPLHRLSNAAVVTHAASVNKLLEINTVRGGDPVSMFLAIFVECHFLQDLKPLFDCCNLNTKS